MQWEKIKIQHFRNSYSNTLCETKLNKISRWLHSFELQIVGYTFGFHSPQNLPKTDFLKSTVISWEVFEEKSFEFALSLTWISQEQKLRLGNFFLSIYHFSIRSQFVEIKKFEVYVWNKNSFLVNFPKREIYTTVVSI